MRLWSVYEWHVLWFCWRLRALSVSAMTFETEYIDQYPFQLLVIRISGGRTTAPALRCAPDRTLASLLYPEDSVQFELFTLHDGHSARPLAQELICRQEKRFVDLISVVGSDLLDGFDVQFLELIDS